MHKFLTRPSHFAVVCWSHRPEVCKFASLTNLSKPCRAARVVAVVGAGHVPGVVLLVSKGQVTEF